MDDSQDELVSTHIFVFPFKWDYMSDGKNVDSTIDKRLNVREVEKALLENWEEDNNVIEDDKDYSKYIYFYDNVRQAIYGKDKYLINKKELKFNIFEDTYEIFKSRKTEQENKIVRNFKHKNIGYDDEYKKKYCKDIYKIEIGKKGEEVDDDEEKQKTHYNYSLKIKSIKLKIYDTGVGNLIYVLENYDKDTKAEDILRINDYGRRIYPQYLPLENVQNSFLAKKIILELEKYKGIEENFIYEIKKTPNRISKTIMDLLGDNFKCNKEELEKGKVFISPIIDDRMFTLSLYKNSDLSQDLKKDWENNEFWYKYVFIDNGDEPTCQDKEMRKDLLKKSTYSRWKEDGTFYGISRYSFVMLLDNKAPGYLNSHFENMYYEMVLLALNQRASILRFSDEASRIVTLGEEEALINVKKLQKYYVRFINDIYFREVTAQEQGIELYNKLIDMMNIERDVKVLGDEIDGIHKYTALIANEVTSNLLKIITYLGIGFTACNFAINIFGKKAIPIDEWSFDFINDKFNLGIAQRIVWPIFILILILFFMKEMIKYEKVRAVKVIFFILIVICSVLVI